MKKMVFLLSLLALLAPALVAQSIHQTLRGQITDLDNKLPVVSATISISNSNPIIATLSNKDGNFRFDSIPIGRVTIEVHALGYEKVVIPNIVVQAGKEVVLTIPLQEKVTQLKEVFISVDKNNGQPLNDMVLVSGRSVSPEQTNRYAGGFNDPSRILSNFAGVTNTLDGSNDIIIRGNSPKYMQWRLEGVQITNPNHFADQGTVGGTISTLNNNLLAASDFYTGAFTAEYGDALSGVYDLKLRSGNNEKREAIVGFGVTGTELTVEGPFKKGKKASYLVNYRYSTISMLNKLGLVPDFNGDLNFQDAAFKVVLPTKKIGTFSFFGLGGSSNFLFKDVTPALFQTPGSRYSPDKTGEDFKKGSHLMNLGINHTLTLNRKSHLTSSVSYSNEAIKDDVFESFVYKLYDNNGAYVKDSAVDGRLNFNGRLKKTAYRAELTYSNKINSRIKLLIGSKYALLNYDFTQSMFRDSTNNRFTLVNFNENVQTIRNFITGKFRWNEQFTIIAGVHNMNVLLNKKSTLEPRLAFNWKITNSSSLNAGYGNHSAMESIHHYFTNIQLPNGSVTTPNKNLDLLKAHHFVIGYDKRIGKKLMLKLEAYYQHLYNLPVANSDTNIFATINEGLEFQYIDLVNKGTGTNYGLELSLERFYSNQFYYLINSSVYQSTYKALDGKKRNTRFNGNYLVNFLFGKDFSGLGKAANKTISFNSRVFLGGGKKIIPLLRGSDGQLAVDPAANQYYDYSRAYKNGLDNNYAITLSVSYKIDIRNTTHEVFLNIDNITNNRARLSEYYDPAEPGNIGYLKQGSVFPNLLYRVYF